MLYWGCDGIPFFYEIISKISNASRGADQSYDVGNDIIHRDGP